MRIELKADTKERRDERNFVDKTANFVLSWPKWMLGDYSEIKDPHKTTMSNKPENHIYTAAEIEKITREARDEQRKMAKQVAEIAIPLITKQCLVFAEKGQSKFQFTIGQFSELSEFSINKNFNETLQADASYQIEKMLIKLGYRCSVQDGSIHVYWFAG
jgi:hypothetical protein